MTSNTNSSAEIIAMKTHTKIIKLKTITYFRNANNSVLRHEHNFIFFCPINTHVFHKTCTKIYTSTLVGKKLISTSINTRSLNIKNNDLLSSNI
jgi:hypothetical protein